MGVNINRTIALTFLHRVGALAGAAGVTLGLSASATSRQDLGFNAGLKAFTAAVLGGIGNITGAALGGFIIGFIEIVAAVAGPQPLGSASSCSASSMIVLVFRPSGLLGQQTGRAGMSVVQDLPAQAPAGTGDARQRMRDFAGPPPVRSTILGRHGDRRRCCCR